MITFEGVTAGGCMTGFFHSIEVAKQNGINAYPALRDALASLVGVEVARSSQPLDDTHLAAFRLESAAAMMAMGPDLQDFAEHLADEAQQATDASEADYYDLCLRRTMLELLRTAYAESPAVAAIDPSDLDRTDTELRRIAPEQPEPFSPEFIPAGLPASHWWWHAR